MIYDMYIYIYIYPSWDCFHINANWVGWSADCASGSALFQGSDPIHRVYGAHRHGRRALQSTWPVMVSDDVCFQHVSKPLLGMIEPIHLFQGGWKHDQYWIGQCDSDGASWGKALLSRQWAGVGEECAGVGAVGLEVLWLAGFRILIDFLFMAPDLWNPCDLYNTAHMWWTDLIFEHILVSAESADLKRFCWARRRSRGGRLLGGCPGAATCRAAKRKSMEEHRKQPTLVLGEMEMGEKEPNKSVSKGCGRSYLSFFQHTPIRYIYIYIIF